MKRFVSNAGFPGTRSGQDDSGDRVRWTSEERGFDWLRKSSDRETPVSLPVPQLWHGSKVPGENRFGKIGESVEPSVLLVKTSLPT